MNVLLFPQARLEAGSRLAIRFCLRGLPVSRQVLLLEFGIELFEILHEITFDLLKVAISTPAPLAPRSRNSGLCTFRERLLVLEDLFHYRLRLWFSCQGC